ncbi:hypothetical protein BsWGS_16449 [Bradybaena similaris]
MFTSRPLQGVSPSLTLRPSAERSPSKFCENGRVYITDPTTGQPVCLCQLENHSAHSLQAHPALRGLRVFPTTRPTFGDIHNYQRQLSTMAHLTEQSNGLLPAQLPYHPYGAMYAGMDVNGGPIRKAATRETTGPLKIWLSEHKKNPYPTKAEKIMLAIITRMTLTQVSTWFANARRRLKKDNRLSPGGGDDDNVGIDSDQEGDLDSVSAPEMDGQVKSVHRSDAPLSSEGEGEPDSFSDISDDDNEVFRPDSRDRPRTPSKHRAPVRTSTPETSRTTIPATSPDTTSTDILATTPDTAPSSPVAITLKTFATRSPNTSSQKIFDASSAQSQQLLDYSSSETQKPKPKIWSISHILDS